MLEHDHQAIERAAGGVREFRQFYRKHQRLGTLDHFMDGLQDAPHILRRTKYARDPRLHIWLAHELALATACIGVYGRIRAKFARSVADHLDVR